MTRASNIRRATTSPPTKINKNACLNPLNPRTDHKKQATNYVVPNPLQHRFPHDEDISVENIGWNEWKCQKVAATMTNYMPFPSLQKILSDMLMVLGEKFDIDVWDITVGENTCWMVVDNSVVASRLHRQPRSSIRFLVYSFWSSADASSVPHFL